MSALMRLTGGSKLLERLRGIAKWAIITALVPFFTMAIATVFGVTINLTFMVTLAVLGFVTLGKFPDFAGLPPYWFSWYIDWRENSMTAEENEKDSTFAWRAKQSGVFTSCYLAGVWLILALFLGLDLTNPFDIFATVVVLGYAVMTGVIVRMFYRMSGSHWLFGTHSPPCFIFAMAMLGYLAGREWASGDPAIDGDQFYGFVTVAIMIAVHYLSDMLENPDLGIPRLFGGLSDHIRFKKRGETSRLSKPFVIILAEKVRERMYYGNDTTRKFDVMKRCFMETTFVAWLADFKSLFADEGNDKAMSEDPRGAD